MSTPVDPAVTGKAGSQSKYRPPFQERMHKDRTEPVRIEVTTEWSYSESSECICCEGRHAFGRAAYVTATDVPARYDSDNSVRDHLHRAIEAFGDDVDLIIEVRRAGTIDENSEDYRRGWNDAAAEFEVR